MIIETQQDVTEAVLGEMHRTPDRADERDPLRLVKHLHAFVREVKLTEKEFQEAIGLRQRDRPGRPRPSHNEAMLLSGALGVSNLVCLMNNGAKGTRPTQANNLGPFYRAGAPQMCRMAPPCCRSPTPGPALIFQGLRLKTENGEPDCRRRGRRLAFLHRSACTRTRTRRRPR